MLTRIAAPAFALILATHASAAETKLELKKVTAQDVLRLAAEPGATATIVNVWATWCEPCKAEMVDLVEFHKAYSGKGVRLILVSADDAAVDADRESAQSFLRKSGVSGVSYILGESTDRFVKAFEPKWGQTVPATFFFDSKGRKSSFKIGRISLQELKSRIVPLLGK